MTPPTHTKWRARLRLALLITTIGFIGLVIVVLVASRIVAATWNGDKVGTSVSRWVSSSLKGQGGPTKQAFVFERVDYPWWPAVVSLFGGAPVRFDTWGVTIWDPDGKEVIHAEHVQAGLALDALVWHKLLGKLPGGHDDLELHFSNAKVFNVRCVIVDKEDQPPNIVRAFTGRNPQPDDQNSKDGMVLTVDGSTVTHGHYKMNFPGWVGRIDDFHLEVKSLRYSTFKSEQKPEGKGPAFTYSVRSLEAPVGEMLIKHGPGGVARGYPLEDFVATRFEAIEPDSWDMRITLTTRSLGALIGAEGSLTNLYSKHPGVDMALGVDHAGRILDTVVQGDSPQMITGDPNLRVHMKGPFSAVTMSGTAGEVDVHMGGIDARHVSGHFHVADQVVRFYEIMSEVAGGRVTGELILEMKPERWLADLHLDGLHVMKLGPLVPLELFAYLGGAFQSIEHLGKDIAIESQHLSLKGIDITLYRRKPERLPNRVVLRGKL